MIDTNIVDTTVTIPPGEHSIAQRGKKHWLTWHRVALVGITLISVFMNFYQLGKNGFGSYYPAAQKHDGQLA